MFSFDIIFLFWYKDFVIETVIFETAFNRLPAAFETPARSRRLASDESIDMSKSWQLYGEVAAAVDVVEEELAEYLFYLSAWVEAHPEFRPSSVEEVHAFAGCLNPAGSWMCRSRSQVAQLQLRSLARPYQIQKYLFYKGTFWQQRIPALKPSSECFSNLDFVKSGEMMVFGSLLTLSGAQTLVWA